MVIIVIDIKQITRMTEIATEISSNELSFTSGNTDVSDSFDWLLITIFEDVVVVLVCVDSEGDPEFIRTIAINPMQVL